MRIALRHLLKKELNPHTRTFNRQPEPRYAITLEVGGVPVKYLKWDASEVWKWGKTPKGCACFPSEQTAKHNAELCSVSWRYPYSIRRLS